MTKITIDGVEYTNPEITYERYTFDKFQYELNQTVTVDIYIKGDEGDTLITHELPCSDVTPEGVQDAVMQYVEGL